MNLFRALGDGFHVLAFLILFLKFFSKSGIKGVSGKTQFLYTVLFCLRYLDMAMNFVSLYNSIMKIFFIMGSLTAVIVVYVVMKDSSETKYDSFRIEILLIPVTILAYFVNHDYTVLEVCWTWSIYMEVVALIPQFYMSLKSGAKVDFFLVSYVASLVLYRGLYIANWYYRYTMEGYYDLIASGSGVVEAAIGAVGLVLMVSKYIECCCFSDPNSGNKHPSIYTLPFVTQGFPRDYNLIRSDKTMKKPLNCGPYSNDLSVPILQEEENA